LFCRFVVQLAVSGAEGEAEREAALAVEQAVYGDLFSVVLKIENQSKNAPVD
jgi:hypothetical protein